MDNSTSRGTEESLWGGLSMKGPIVHSKGSEKSEQTKSQRINAPVVSKLRYDFWFQA